MSEEFRRANHGHVQVMVGAVFKECFLKRGVCHVGAVPCQQIVHAMNNREGDMGGIHLRFGRELKNLHNGVRKWLNLCRDLQLGYVGHHFQAPRGCGGVSFGNLCADGNRRVEAKPHPLLIPPLLGHPLMRRHRLLMAAVSRQVAGNRRFNVNRLHGTRPYRTTNLRKE